MALIGDLLLRVGPDLVSWKALQSSLDETKEKLTQFSENIAGIGEALGAGLETGIAGALVKIGETFEEATNTIIGRTGAMGSELQAFEGTFSSVFGQVDESAKDVAGTMTELARRLDLAGPALEAMTKGLLDLSKVSREQVAPLAIATSKAFAEWQLSTEQQTKALETLMQVSQASGARITELAGQLQQFAPALKGLGLSFDQAAQLMGQFAKAGVSVEPAMMAIQKGLLTLSKAGLADPLAGLQEIAREIKNATTEGAAFEIGAKAFGRGATIIVESIRSGKIDLENFSGSLKLGTRSLTETADEMKTIGEKMSELWHQVLVAIEPAARAFVKAVSDIIDHSHGIVDALSDMSKAFASMSEGHQQLVLGLVAIAAAAPPVTLSLKLASAALAAFIGALPAVSTITAGAATEILGLNTAFLILQASLTGGGVAGAVAGINESFAAMGPLMRAAAGATLAVGAAFAGWKLGEWLRDTFTWAQKFGDWLGDLLLKLPLVTSAIDKFSSVAIVKPVQDLAEKVKATEEQLAKLGVTVSQGGRSLVQYASYLADLKTQMGLYGDAAANAAAKSKQTADNLLAQALAAQEAAKKFAEWQQKFVDTVKLLQLLPDSMNEFRQAVLAGEIDATAKLHEMRTEIEKASDNYTKMGVAGKQALTDLAAKFLELKHNVDQLDFEKFLLSFSKVNDQFGAIFDKMSGPLRDYIERLRTAVAANQDALSQIENAGKGPIEMLKTLAESANHLAESQKAVLTTLTTAFVEYGRQTKTALTESIKAFEESTAHGADLASRLSPQLYAIVQQIREMDTAYHALGITSSKAYDIALTAATKYYDEIVSGNSTERDQLEAQLALIRAQINAALAHGQAVDGLNQKYADTQRLVEKLGYSQRVWIDYTKEFQTIFNQAMASVESGLANAIVAGQGFGQMFMNVIKQIETAVVQLLVKAFLVDLKNALLGTQGQVTELEKAFKSLASSVSKLFGGGSPVSGGAGGAGAGAGSSSGSGATGGSSTLGILGIAVDALSGIVQGLQMAHLISTTGKIEENTRRLDLVTEGPDGVLEHVKQTRLIFEQFLSDFRGWYHDAFASLMTTQESALEQLQKIQINTIGGGSGGGAGANADLVAALQAQLQDLTNKLSADDAIIATLQSSIAAAGQAGQQLTTTADLATNAFTDTSAAIQTVADTTVQASAAIQTASAAVADTTTPIIDQVRSQLDLINSLKAAGKQGTKEYSDAQAKLNDLVKQIPVALNDSSQAATQAAGSIGALTTATDNLATVSAGAGAVVGAAVATVQRDAGALAVQVQQTVQAVAVAAAQAFNGAAHAAADVTASSPAAVALTAGEGVANQSTLGKANPYMNLAAQPGQVSPGVSVSVTMTGNTILSANDALGVMKPAIDAIRNAVRLN